MSEFGKFIWKFKKVQGKLSTGLRESPKRIKVAILDDGFTLIDNMKYFKGLGGIKLIGASFEGPNTGHEGGFPMTTYYSETGHGTKMTKLVQQICPDIDLYIAKMAQVGSEKGPHTSAAIKVLDQHLLAVTKSQRTINIGRRQFIGRAR